MPAAKSSSKSVTKSEETFTVAVREYGRAVELFHKRDWSGASEAFRAFIETFGEKPDVSELLDRARTHRGACEERLSDLPPDPDSPDGWLHQAVSLSNEGRIDEALASYDRAEALGVPLARVCYARAAALALADRNDEAIEQLKRAIELDPENRAFSLGDPDFERLRELAGYVALVEPPQSVLPPSNAYAEEVSSHGNEGEATSLEPGPFSD